MIEAPNLYEEVLSARGREPLPGAKPPRGSAAIILWRRTADGELQVYWVRRSERVRFMPGWHAFIGGSVSRTDGELPVLGEPRDLVAQTALDSLPTGQRGEASSDEGLVACALRELFEEVGLLVARGPIPTTDALDRMREAMLEEPADFADFLRHRELQLDAGRLTFAGRWLTPPLAPLRFDNRFYLLHWPTSEARQPDVWPGELDHGEWISPGEAQELWLRSEVMAAPPIVHTLSVLAREGPEAGLPALQRPVEAELGPFRRVEFRPGILMFPLPTATLPPATHTNCYLLGMEDAVVVDPGSADSTAQTQLVEALGEAASRLGRRPTAIWLTHHHPDHIAGVLALQKELRLPVAAHRATAERVAAAGIEVDRFLEHDEVYELGPGFPVRILHTPGHARGHLAFFAENHRTLLSGDLVSALSTIIIDPPEGNMGQFLQSLEAMAELHPDTLFPAHGPILGQAEAFLRQVKEHRLWREERVLQAWEAGLREPAEILRRVYDEIPKMIWPLAERQIRAHLEHLESLGSIS